MSDPKYGEPVDEHAGHTPVDDVIGSAREGLAEAEAASRDAVSDAELAAHGHDPVHSASDLDPAVYGVIDEPAEHTPATAAATGSGYPADVAETAVYPDAVTPSEPVSTTPPPAETTVAPVAETVVVAPAGPQPIFVQAPEAPLPQGNRGAAGAIGLLAALAFAVLYLACSLVFDLIDGSIPADLIGENALLALTQWWFWVPVVVFYLGFWLLGAIINRGRWGQWVIFGLVVGVIAYGGHIAGELFQAPFWSLTAREGAALVEGELLAPLAIAAFVIARELTIWFGAWVARRGARVTEANVEAQREYERTLAAGPTLQH